MARADRIIGVALIVLAAVYYRLADDIEVGLASDLLGPQAFPRGLAIVLAIASAVLVLRSFVGARPGAGSVAAAEDERLGRLAGALVLTVVYLLFLPRVGFLVLTPLYLGAFTALLGYRRPLPLAATAAGVTFTLYLVFARLLGVRLPAGLLGG